MLISIVIELMRMHPYIHERVSIMNVDVIGLLESTNSGYEIYDSGKNKIHMYAIKCKYFI